MTKRQPCARCRTSMNTDRGRESYRTTHHSRGLCGACHNTARARDELLDYPRATCHRDDVLDRYAVLRRQRYTYRQIAELLDMPYPTFERALMRARAVGDPRARNPWGRIVRSDAA